MSETILIKKKKEKKEYNYEAVAKRLKVLVQKWKDIDKEVAYEIHKEYIVCPNFDKLCVKLGTSTTTMYNLFDKHELQRKYPKMSEAQEEIWDERKEQELEPAIIEDELETELEDRKFKETYAILKNAQRLSKSMFQVPEKQELIEELQDTVKKLTTLLLKLESNIEE